MNSLLRQAKNQNLNTNMDMQTALRSVKSDPIQFLQNSGFNVPNNIGNNPQSIVQYLLNSGQVSQQMVKQLMGRYGL